MCEIYVRPDGTEMVRACARTAIPGHIMPAIGTRWGRDGHLLTYAPRKVAGGEYVHVLRLLRGEASAVDVVTLSALTKALRVVEGLHEGRRIVTLHSGVVDERWTNSAIAAARSLGMVPLDGAIKEVAGA